MSYVNFVSLSVVPWSKQQLAGPTGLLYYIEALDLEARFHRFFCSKNARSIALGPNSNGAIQNVLPPVTQTWNPAQTIQALMLKSLTNSLVAILTPHLPKWTGSSHPVELHWTPGRALARQRDLKEQKAPGPR